MLAQNSALLEKMIQVKAADAAEEANGSEGRGKRGEPWERECDRRSTRYAAGEYRLDLDVPDGVATKTTIVIKEDMAALGTRVWDCAALMSKWFEKALRVKGWPWRSGTEQPLRVLELGAGTGLLAIALAKLGAAVVATEYGPIVPWMTEVCEQNGVLLQRKAPEDGSPLGLPRPADLVAGKVICHELDWYALDATKDRADGGNFDVVLVSDCTLTPSDATEILKVIKHFVPLGTEGIDIIVGACHEREGTPTFMKGAEETYKSMEVLDKSTQHEEYSSNRHMIMRLHP